MTNGSIQSVEIIELLKVRAAERVLGGTAGSTRRKRLTRTARFIAQGVAAHPGRTRSGIVAAALAVALTVAALPADPQARPWAAHSATRSGRERPRRQPANFGTARAPDQAQLSVQESVDGVAAHATRRPTRRGASEGSIGVR
jgi:hypothetical protein